MGTDQPVVCVIDHDGDAALEIEAGDEAGCLRGAVWGLASLMGVARTAPAGTAGDAPAAASSAATPARPAGDVARRPDAREVRVDGATPVERLVALIDRVIAVIDVEGLVAVDADVTVTGDHADAHLALAPCDPGEVAAPPKAATWHAAASEPTDDGGWRARLLIDR